jgi:hypothetical protein
MSIRLKSLLTQFITGEKVTQTDLNDTFEYVGRNLRTIKDVTSPYTPTLDDDVLILKPSAASNSYTNLTMSGHYLYGDKNFASADNNVLFFGSASGTTQLAKYNIATNTYSVLGNANANGTTCHATDGTNMFYTDYTANIKKMDSAGAITNFATCPASVYGLTRNPVTGDLYAVGYTGKVYKITPAGVVSTVQSTDLHGNTVDAIWCDASDNIYITTNAQSWRITGGVAYAISNIIPSNAGSYRQADNSIYYRKQINGIPYFCKYSFTTELESILTKCQYSSGSSAYNDGTFIFEGQSSSPNQFSKLQISTYVPVLSLTLPAPSVANKGKEYLITAPYGYVNSPFIFGKILVDIVPTNTDNALTIITIPYSSWSANTRSFRVISDGTYWITLRQ